MKTVGAVAAFLLLIHVSMLSAKDDDNRLSVKASNPINIIRGKGEVKNLTLDDPNHLFPDKRRMNEKLLPYVIREVKTYLLTFSTRASCTCAVSICSCCSDSYIFNLRKKCCLQLIVDPKEFTLSLGLTFNDMELFTVEAPASNPPAACAPIPIPPVYPLTYFCIRAYDIKILAKGLRVCTQIEGKIDALGFNGLLISLNLNCFRISFSQSLVLEKSGKQPVRGLINTDLKKLLPRLYMSREIL